MFELDITFRKPRKRKTTFPRTPGVAIRVINVSCIRTSPVASPGLRAILATREGSILKLDITFRKPRKRKTTFPRTPGVAERVFDISSIRTSPVASPGLRAMLATREGSIFELRSTFRKPRKRKTTFPRTPGVAQRVIDTFVICTLFRAKASARFASSCRVPLRAVGGNFG